MFARNLFMSGLDNQILKKPNVFKIYARKKLELLQAKYSLFLNYSLKNIFTF